jgi:hypothetical protein
MSGSEFQREKDKVAAIMQEKQQKGEGTLPPNPTSLLCFISVGGKFGDILEIWTCG